MSIQTIADNFNKTVGNLNNDDGYDCDICKNKGCIMYITEDNTLYQRDCKCKKIRNILFKARRSGLGNILSDMTFDKYTSPNPWQVEIKNKAISFCSDDNSNWFYIGGQVGCGKSHLCTAIAGYYIKQGRDVVYMLWCEESKKLKAIANDIAYQSEVKKYKDAEVLYIDDFLKVRSGSSPSDADVNLAFEIINHRLLKDDKITIISSEKTLDEIMDYDEATMSRIFQKTGNYKINIEKDRNKNYRLHQ